MTSIWDYAFIGCTGLTAINVDSNNQHYASVYGLVLSKDLLTLKIVPTGLKTFNFPETVRYISKSAFNGSSDNPALLEELIIPDRVETKEISWYGLTNLKKLRLPKNYVLRKLEFASISFVKEVEHLFEDESFYNVSPLLPNLEELSIGKIENHLGYYFPHSWRVKGKYYDCEIYNAVGDKSFKQKDTSYVVNESLEKIIIRDEKIPVSAFINTDIFDIVIENPVKSIGTDAFKNSGITQITVSDSIENIEVSTFSGCKNLQCLQLPFPGAGSLSNVSNFGELFGTQAIDGMRAVTQQLENGETKTYYLPAGLRKLVLSEGCEMIPYGGLYNCNMLDTLVLPTTLYMVGDKALYGCARLKDIFCKGADPAVAFDGTFEGVRVSSCKLHIPYNTTDIYKRSAGWESFYYFEEEAPIAITVEKNIENAGVVYGLDEYRPGQTAKLRAVAHSGYRFEGWRENGATISAEADLTFTVTDSRSLVAWFSAVMDEGGVTVAPAGDGVSFGCAPVSGAATYTIDIYNNAEMTSLCATTTVGASQTRAAQVQLSINGLQPETDYFYSITATSAEGNVLSQFTGSFTTTSTSGIDNAPAARPEVKARFDASGRRVEAPVRGLNILHMSDGTVRKVMVK